jgi:hypothetical protein
LINRSTDQQLGSAKFNACVGDSLIRAIQMATFLPSVAQGEQNLPWKSAAPVEWTLMNFFFSAGRREHAKALGSPPKGCTISPAGADMRRRSRKRRHHSKEASFNALDGDPLRGAGRYGMRTKAR